VADSTTQGAAAPRNILKTLVAVGWMYGGRGIGMLWTLALVGKLSVGDYGKYGMGFALSAVVGPPLDNPFNVRAMRESDQHFQAERTSRFLLGLFLMVTGACLINVNYILWFGLVIAGGEMVFKSYQSQAARDGHPQVTWRMDTIRQVSSVTIASAYLFGADEPSLSVASLLYCTPYLVVLVLAARRVWGHRPGVPGPPRLIAALVGEMLGMCIYLQGDVLLLGFLTDSTTVGYYALTVTVTVALAAIGQSFAMTYHEPLRRSGGDLSTGPSLRHIVFLGLGTGGLVLITGVVLLATPAPTELAVAMIIMAAFCAMRTMSSVFAVILYAQRRDTVRLGANLSLVPVKLGAVAALAQFGAIGAAIATVGADAILLVIYLIAIYRRKDRAHD
jgi:O-antigen/teichoic acid export membrane protein